MIIFFCSTAVFISFVIFIFFFWIVQFGRVLGLQCQYERIWFDHLLVAASWIVVALATHIFLSLCFWISHDYLLSQWSIDLYTGQKMIKFYWANNRAKTDTKFTGIRIHRKRNQMIFWCWRPWRSWISSSIFNCDSKILYSSFPCSCTLHNTGFSSAKITRKVLCCVLWVRNNTVVEAF